MSTYQSRRQTLRTIRSIAAWIVAFAMFFPILWMLLTSFKSELDAFSMPPRFAFEPTLENYRTIFARANYMHYAWNSVAAAGGATVLGMLVAVPAAYAFAFHPTARTRSTLLWMLSTKMLPGVGVLVPIYLLARDANLLDSTTAL
ncbi:MAG TPA: hypothetical protein VNO21_27460, partial [Polyangiaceae bacterium]|nr:hypothetical protein [Polyangiaceae bacterium]